MFRSILGALFRAPLIAGALISSANSLENKLPDFKVETKRVVKSDLKKAVYFNKYGTNSVPLIKQNLEQRATSDLNSVFVNVVDETGYFAVPLENAYAQEFKLHDSSLRFYSRNVSELSKKGTIFAHAVVAKNKLLSELDEGTYAIKREDGTNTPFVDLNSEFVQDYLITNLSEAASVLGNQIETAKGRPLQKGDFIFVLDYIRYPDRRDAANPVFPFLGETEKEIPVCAIVQGVKDRLPENVQLAICFYGDNLNPSLCDKNLLGQNVRKMMNIADIAMPMIYWDYYDTESETYKKIYAHTRGEIGKMQRLTDKIIIPLIQGGPGKPRFKKILEDNMISHLHLIEKQVQACNDAGVGHCLWNTNTPEDYETIYAATVPVPNDVLEQIAAQEKPKGVFAGIFR